MFNIGNEVDEKLWSYKNRCSQLARILLYSCSISPFNSRFEKSIQNPVQECLSQLRQQRNVKAKWLTKLITTKLRIAQINLIFCLLLLSLCFCCFCLFSMSMSWARRQLIHSNHFFLSSMFFTQFSHNTKLCMSFVRLPLPFYSGNSKWKCPKCPNRWAISWNFLKAGPTKLLILIIAIILI